MSLKCILKLFLNCYRSRALLLQEYVLHIIFNGRRSEIQEAAGLVFPVSSFTMHHYLNIYFKLLGSSFFFLRHNKSVFRYLVSVKNWMICEKLLQFVTATCSLDHRLIHLTKDENMLRPSVTARTGRGVGGQCSVVLLTPQHSIAFRTILSVLCHPTYLREFVICSGWTLANNISVCTFLAIVLQSSPCVCFLRRGLIVS